MDDRLKVSRFWEENFSIIQQTKDVQCPTPEEVYSDFILQTGLTHIDLDNFKVITCSLGRGIRLNKKRRKNQKRFYNVAPKRKKLRPEEQDYDSQVLDDLVAADDKQQPADVIHVGNVIRQEDELLGNYLQHQASMQINAMTVSALREKQNAPSRRKQMFEILRGKGLYKKFAMSKFKTFTSWLKSPSGGQLACPDEISSEVSRFLYFSFPSKLKWNRLLDAKAFNNYLITTKDAGLGPDGLKTKIERITIALKFLAHRKPKLHSKCRRAIAEYSEWLKPLAKQKKVLRMQNSWRDELCGFNLTMEDLDTAVSEDTIAQFIAIMKQAMSKTRLTQKEYRLIVDTLITITITQESAIRPGAFQFMTLQEIDNPGNIYITY
ncbi:uncharacterized protein LOC114543745 [Dendronephthya gigantea]|uniref:uncharacterized protein LOC114543745 n=1 Tax=Dendronephthya gigantea TaxID=151771 RepID=UPI00106D9DED|nr:uncharacterized protein LOC114543745 [Dendronephthya gigantea]